MPIHNRIRTQDWQFTDEPNVLVLTSRQVTEEHLPVLEVARDAEGVWSFMSGRETALSDARFVTLDSVLSQDATLYEVAELPKGGRWTREKAGTEWQA